MTQDFLLVINIILLILPVSHDPFPLHFIGCYLEKVAFKSVSEEEQVGVWVRDLCEGIVPPTR